MLIYESIKISSIYVIRFTTDLPQVFVVVQFQSIYL